MTDISGFRFSTGIHFTFPQGSFINAGECMLIAKTAAVYKDRGYQVFQVDSGRLENAGEELRLINREGMEVDIVNYDDHFPWPEEPDGEGPSLELKDPLLDNLRASSWKASDKAGGTPGKSMVTGTGKWYKAPAGNELLSAWPNPFHSAISVKYTITEDANVRIYIFNSYGHAVDILVDEFQKPGTFEATWIPKNLPSGIYLIHLSSDKFTQIKKIVFLNSSGELKMK